MEAFLQALSDKDINFLVSTAQDNDEQQSIVWWLVDKRVKYRRARDGLAF
jgi:hypothetical protein